MSDDEVPGQRSAAPDDDILARLMPLRTDELDGMEIEVQPPDSKLVRGAEIRIEQLFLHDDFEVVVRTRSQRVRFEVNLPEFLPALAAYLRSGRNESTEQLLWLGDRLTIKVEGSVYRLNRFDLETNQPTSLDLTRKQLVTLHRRLVAELIVAAHRADGAFADLAGLEDLEIGTGDGV